MKLNVDAPYNALSLLPVAQSKIRTIRILRQVLFSHQAIFEAHDDRYRTTFAAHRELSR